MIAVCEEARQWDVERPCDHHGSVDIQRVVAAFQSQDGPPVGLDPLGELFLSETALKAQGTDAVTDFPPCPLDQLR